MQLVACGRLVGLDPIGNLARRPEDDLVVGAASSSGVIGGGGGGAPDRSRACSMSSYFHETYRSDGRISSHASSPCQANVDMCRPIPKRRPSASALARRTRSPNASGVAPSAMNPSPIRPARRTARSAYAPIQIGGPSRPGRGVTITGDPAAETGSPAHAPRRTATASSRRRTRSRSDTPRPSNSSSRQPSPTPRIKRPPEIRSTVAASSAMRIGSCSGISSSPVPISTRLVRAAIAAQSGNNDGAYPSSTKWCSDVQTESNPSSSANVARSSASA